MTGAENIPEEIPADAVICYPPAEGGDEVVEGRVLAEGEPGYVPPAGMAQSADHWPAFAPVKVTVDDGGALDAAARSRVQAAAEAAAGAGFVVWHDEAVRLEERGRLDRGGCECPDCLGDKYSGEDYY